MIVRGRVWKLESDARAIDLLPARHDQAAMMGRWSECTSHIMEDMRPDAAGRIKAGDIIVARGVLGAGHAHYHRGAVMACKGAGIAAILADTVNALFLRAAIDAGYLVWACPGMSDLVGDGDILDFDARAGKAVNRTSGESMDFQPLAPTILAILDAGGSRDWALRRIAAAHASDQTAAL